MEAILINQVNHPATGSGMTERQFHSTHSEGKDIYLITLRNRRGTEVSITNYGAVLRSFSVLRNGQPTDLVLGFDRLEDYWSDAYRKEYPYFGAAIGRYANRIANAQFALNGSLVHLNANQGSDQLHGGCCGFDSKIWDIAELGGPDESYVTLQYHSPDGEENYPGNLTVNLRFELAAESDELSLSFSACTDAPTAVNLTHHSYFNLNNGRGSIGSHHVKINASRYLEQNEGLIVTGRLLPVAGTPLDFKVIRRVDSNWNEETGFDQTFVIDRAPGQLRPAAETWLGSLGLQILTDQPVVHFYAGKYIPRLRGKNEQEYGPYSGFCFETQTHPNAVNIPSFPNTILHPGQEYLNRTVYRVVGV